MIDLDLKNLCVGVEKRLDEIFSDELKRPKPPISEFELSKIPSLKNLRKTVMSLEWEVTDDHLNDFMKELNRLKRAFKKNHPCQKLLRILFLTGRNIRVYKSDTHPHIFKMLYRAYNSFAKTASGKYCDQEKAKIVNAEIKFYNSLISKLKRKNKTVSQRSLKNVNPLEKSLISPSDSLIRRRPYSSKDGSNTYYVNLDNDFKELKKFMYAEIKKLRKDLQVILTLIQNKA